MVLNPDLLRQLQLACCAGPPVGLPGGHVLISNPGRPLSGSYHPREDGSASLTVHDHGETYRVCCPVCGDTRHRLYINHRWGVYDRRSQSSHYELLHCFNEECEKTPGFHHALRKRLDLWRLRLGGAHAGGKRLRPSGGVRPIQTFGSFEYRCKPPFDAVPLQSLPDDHPAAVFLAGRGHDHRKLGEHFGAWWVGDTHSVSAGYRIVLPWHDPEGNLAGWQGRWVGPEVTPYLGQIKHPEHGNLYGCTRDYCHTYQFSHDKDPQCVNPGCRVQGGAFRIAKWYTGPGTKTGRSFFNFEGARHWPFIVLMEGPMDVIRLGTPEEPDVRGPGMAVFGHSLQAEQRRILAQQKDTRWGIDTPAFLVFDPDLWERPNERARLDEIMAFLREQCYQPVLVRLADGKDPGDTDHASLWAQLVHAANEAGVIIPEGANALTAAA